MGVETHGGPDGGKQKLSAAARRAKRARDLADANKPDREKNYAIRKRYIR